MKILLSAYACEPGRGSEPGVGWNMAFEVAKHHQVWVFTSNTHRLAIEAELAIRPIPNLNFVYFDPFGWVYDWTKEGKRPQWSIHLHYYLWQIWAYFVALPLHRQICFDLVQHVTYVRYSSPSFLAFLPVPFLWGPVGGGESAPRSFWQDFSLRGKIYETLRDLARWLGECDPFVRLTAVRSVLAFATTEDTAKRLRQIGASNVQVFSQVGLPKEEITSLAQHAMPSTATVRFISIGRLLHWKGFHLGLRAFAQAGLPDAEYWILGDGPELKRLQTLVADLGITHQVKFWGSLPRAQSLSKLGESHVLVHPSLHDSGGLVCLEAMAAARPVICLDLGGPAVQVTSETGFKVSAHNPDQAVRDLASAMLCLARSPELRMSMGQSGQKKIQQLYNWESKFQTQVQLYEKILGRDVMIQPRVPIYR